MNKSGHSTFYRIVKTHFNFLIYNLGFTIEEPYEYLVELKSANCIVVVVAGNNACNVSIGPLGSVVDQLMSKGFKTGTIDVEVIMKKMAPQENFEKSLSISSFDGIERELEKNVILLKKHCMKLLRGDVSEWVRVRS